MMIKTSHSTFVLVTAAALLSSPVTASDDFQRGFNQGQQRAESIWHNNDGRDCSNISNFQRQINHHINNKYSYSSKTYYATKYFDKGAQQGMMTVLHKYQEKCKNDNSHMNVGQCSGLGQDVASDIAEQYASQYCNHQTLGDSLATPTLYKEQCRSIGVEDCKGAINESLKQFCGHYVNDYQTVQRLEAQCYSQVSENIYNSSNNRGPGGPGGRGPRMPGQPRNNRGPGGPGASGPGGRGSRMPGQPRINFYQEARAGAHPPS